MMLKIAIIVNTSRSSGRDFLRGIAEYRSAFGPWEVCIQRPYYLPNESEEASCFGLEEADGIIVKDARNAEELVSLGLPMVFSDSTNEVMEGVSSIMADSAQVGKMAAEYFLGLGYDNFGFCGFDGLPWSDKRFKSFEATLKENGYDNLFKYDAPTIQGDDSERGLIAAWLKKLPKPCCVFICNDDRAVFTLEACKLAGICVPEEVAVLGVDNDELMCGLSSPPLSSVAMEFENAGFEAARLLEGLIAKKENKQTIIVKAKEVISRQSTDILAIDDAELVAAINFIRRNYNEKVQVKDVVKATNLSRKELEIRFKKRLKRTVNDEITRLRIEAVKRLLTSTNQTNYAIASSLKYTDPEHFSRFFKTATGMSPSEFRQQRSLIKR